MTVTVVKALNIGPMPPNIGVSMRGGNVVRLDCMNNPAFWLEVDMAKYKAHGRIADSAASQRGFKVVFNSHVISSSPGAVSIEFCYTITHPECPDFLIELSVSAK